MSHMHAHSASSSSTATTKGGTEATPKPYPPHPKAPVAQHRDRGCTSSPPPPLPSTHIESLSAATCGSGTPAHTHTHTLTRERAASTLASASTSTLASKLAGSTSGAPFPMRSAFQNVAAHVGARQTPSARETPWLTHEASCAPFPPSTLASSAALRTPQAGTVTATLSMPQRALYGSASSSSSAGGKRAKSTGVESTAEKRTAEKSFCDNQGLQWQQDQERQFKLLTETIHQLLADKARFTG